MRPSLVRIVACFLMLLSGTAWSQAQPAYDVIITNGRIVDGAGNPWFRADIGIRGRRITAIGDLRDAGAARRIDARGNIVSPGFIDMHSHASWNYLVDSRAVSKLTQGITLEIEGEGFSVGPMDEAAARQLAPVFARFGVNGDWRTLGQFFQRLEQHPATINFASYIGTGTVRQLVVGYADRRATPAELDRMRAMVAQAMREGALGVYSALLYPPDAYNSTEELIEMAKVARRYGGVYQTHPRSEAAAADRSMDEVFRIAREANIPAHVTHFKVAQQQQWGTIAHLIDRIQAARAGGLDITADMYAYEWADGSLTALLPPWAQEGGRAAIVARLRDRETRERIKRELVTPSDTWENEYLGLGGGPAGLIFNSARGNPALRRYEGRTLAEIAATEGKDPRDVVLDLIIAGDGSIIERLMSEDDIRRAIVQPWVAFGTDGVTVAPDGPLSHDLVHPRAYGAFPRIFGRYVRELRLVTLEEAVRRATSLAAQRLNIRDRGLLREGYYADIVIFDPATIADTATYEAPHQIARGVNYVLVNGEVVLDMGRVTSARPGMVVRGPGYVPPSSTDRMVHPAAGPRRHRSSDPR